MKEGKKILENIKALLSILIDELITIQMQANEVIRLIDLLLEKNAS